MEIKRFNEYTEEEKKELLKQWWHYYGSEKIVSVDVVIKFIEILNSDPEFVKNVALIDCVDSKTSKGLIRAIKLDNVDEFKKCVDEIVSSEEFLNVEACLEKDFLKKVVGTYNNSQPSVSLDREQIMQFLFEEVRKMVGPNCTVIGIDLKDLMKQEAEMRGEYFLDGEEVNKIYRECLLNEDKGEYTDDEPLVEFAIGDGIKRAGVFNIQRLTENKKTIIEMIDTLSEFESEVPFAALCVDKYGRQWTGEYAIVDELVQLGVATETLSYLYDRSDWSSLPGGVPFIMRNREKDNSNVRGHEAKEFKKVIDEVKNGVYRRDA